MYVVFDLDGVLADTRDVVVKAYRDVGVEMPAGTWGRPWHDWCSPAEHHAKNERYVELIKEGVLDERLLPPLQVMFALRAVGQVAMILTGASLEAVTAFQERYVVKAPVEVIGTSCGTTRKAEVLRTLRATTDFVTPVCYVDDDPVGISIVRWTNDEGIHFVHYIDQTLAELYEEVTKWMR